MANAAADALLFRYGPAALAGVFSMYNGTDPYMDETFHIPQAQKFCKKQYNAWDPKITTFPGLYMYTSVLPMLKFPCTEFYLRFMVVLLGSLSPAVFYNCRKMVAPEESPAASAAVATLMFLYPLSFFYYFLYYTDTASTVTLFAVYMWAWSSSLVSPVPVWTAAAAAVKTEQDLPRAPSFFSQLVLFVLSCAAVLVRQTNAVWVLFVAGVVMASQLHQGQRLRPHAPHATTLGLLGTFVKQLWLQSPALLARTWPLLLPVGSFVYFVVTTGSVAVGDKEHHAPVAHWAMPLHCFLGHAGLLLPQLLMDAFKAASAAVAGDKGPAAGGKAKKGAGSAGAAGAGAGVGWPVWLGMHAVGLALTAYVLRFHALAHPFLLADNRHYTFYLWKWVLSHPTYRLALAPVYYVAAAWTVSRLHAAQGTLWVLIYLAAVGVSLVPAHLLELRYFTPAVLMAILHAPPLAVSAPLAAPAGAAADRSRVPNARALDLGSSGWAGWGEFFEHAAWWSSVLASVAVNMVTVLVFLGRTFKGDDGKRARFMY